MPPRTSRSKPAHPPATAGLRVAPVGHGRIDHEHARIVRLSLLLATQLERGIGRGVLRRLEQAVSSHITYESGLMSRVGYQQRDGHLSLHEGLNAKIRRLRTAFDRGMPPHPQLARDVVLWLRSHAAEADTRVVAWIAAYQAGSAAAQAAARVARPRA